MNGEAGNETGDTEERLKELLTFLESYDFMKLGQAVNRGQWDSAMMTFRSASHITVEADPDMPWTLDGEKEEGHEQVEVQNLHHAIKILKKEEQRDV